MIKYESQTQLPVNYIITFLTPVALKLCLMSGGACLEHTFWHFQVQRNVRWVTMLNAGLTIHNWFQLSFKQSTFGFSPEPLEASLHWPFLSLRITSCYYLSFSRRLRCTLAFSGHPEAREQWHCQNYVDTAAGWLLTLQRRRVTDSPRRRLCSDRLGVFCSHHNQSHISPARLWCTHSQLVSFVKGCVKHHSNGYQHLQFQKKC